MASNDVRRALAGRRAADRDRKRKQRDADKAAGVPRMDAVNEAMAYAIRMLVQKRHGAPKAVPVGSDLHMLISMAGQRLQDRHGIALTNPRARVLLHRAIGG